MEPTVVWRLPAKRGPTTPLVVLLHGRGADEYDLLDLADRFPRSYAFACVRGLVSVEGGGFTWFENEGPARPIASSVAFSIRRLRDWLDGPSVAANSGRCYLLGFSAGMMMAGALLLDEPKRFAGAVLLSGALASAESAPRGRLTGVPVFHGHGSLDDVIPANLAEITAAYLRDRSGAVLTARTYRHAHTISDRELDDIAKWFESSAGT